jgi:hypothetical protein
MAAAVFARSVSGAVSKMCGQSSTASRLGTPPCGCPPSDRLVGERRSHFQVGAFEPQSRKMLPRAGPGSAAAGAHLDAVDRHGRHALASLIVTLTGWVPLLFVICWPAASAAW